MDASTTTWTCAFDRAMTVERLAKRIIFLTHRLPRVLRQAVVEWQVLRSSARVDVLGFDVRLHELGTAGANATLRLRESLVLIQEKDARRFARIQKDLSHIVVKTKVGASYWILSNTCVLELPEVVGRSPALLALTIIHEATHARLTHAGIYPSSRMARRIEARCAAEERSFTLLLQQAGYSGTDKLLAWLDSCLNTEGTKTHVSQHLTLNLLL